MGLPKGRTNNLNGRPIGSISKEVSDHRKFIKEFVQQFCDSGQFKKTFAKLEVRDKMKVVLDLMQYVTPKLQSVSNELSFGENMPTIIFKPAPDYEPVKENGISN